MNKRIGIVFALLVFLAGAVPAMANDIYIAQSAVGGANGADCADAFPVNFFNTAGNWGSAAGQIGPGTTVHLCGTITFPANSTGLTALGSGSSTSPITILFEKGAILQSPVFTGLFEIPAERSSSTATTTSPSTAITPAWSKTLLTERVLPIANRAT